MADQDQLRDLVNTMSRHWWAVFNSIEILIDQGKLETAKHLCEEAKKILKDELKQGWDK